MCRDLTEYKQVEEQRERLLEAGEAGPPAGRAGDDDAGRVPRHRLARAAYSADGHPAVGQACCTGTVSEQERAKVIETIQQSADAQRQLVEDLLDISRITSGKMRLNVRDADLAVVVRAAAEAVRPMAEAKGIRMELALDDAPGRSAPTPTASSRSSGTC